MNLTKSYSVSNSAWHIITHPEVDELYTRQKTLLDRLELLNATLYLAACILIILTLLDIHSHLAVGGVGLLLLLFLTGTTVKTVRTRKLRKLIASRYNAVSATDASVNALAAALQGQELLPKPVHKLIRHIRKGKLGSKAEHYVEEYFSMTLLLDEEVRQLTKKKGKKNSKTLEQALTRLEGSAEKCVKALHDCKKAQLEEADFRLRSTTLHLK